MRRKIRFWENFMVVDSPTHKIAYARLERPVRSGMITYRWLCFKHNKTNGVTRTYLCSKLSENGLPVPGRYVTEAAHEVLHGKVGGIPLTDMVTASEGRTEVNSKQIFASNVSFMHTYEKVDSEPHESVAKRHLVDVETVQRPLF